MDVEAEPTPVESPAPSRGRRMDPRRVVVTGAAVLGLLAAGILVGLSLGNDAQPGTAPSVGSGQGAATGAPSAPPAARRTGPALFGVSVARLPGEGPTQAVTRIKQEYGSLPVARVFSSDAPPDNWNDDPTLAALGDGSDVVYSFKADVEAAAGGQFDEQVRRFLSSKPARVTAWVAFYHEPEDDVIRGTFTTQQFQAATEHLAPVIRDAGGIPTTILMQYTLAPGSGRDWHDYYSPAVDVLAWDAYNTAQKRALPSYKPPQDFVDPVLAVAKETGKAFGWAEFGSPCITTDPDCTGRAAWLASMGQAFRDSGAQFATYWNRPGVKADLDFSLNDPPSVEAYRKLVAG